MHINNERDVKFNKSYGAKTKLIILRELECRKLYYRKKHTSKVKLINIKGEKSRNGLNKFKYLKIIL